MALEGGSGAKCDDRNVKLMAKGNNFGDLLGRLGKYHAVRWHGRIG
jgi:hypothetical protein